MKSYSNMVETSVPWLVSIPGHWELKRNKNIFIESKDTVGENSDQYKLLSLTTRGIIIRDISSGKGKFPKDFNTYKIVNEGGHGVLFV